MEKKKVVLGLMGAGRIGKMHGENILAHVPNAFLKSVADPNLDKDWAERVGIPERLNPSGVDYEWLLQ